METREPLLSIRKLGCQVDGCSLIRDVAFDVGCGESVAILGPNGAGKTTLLRALAGLLPYTGEALLLNREIRSVSRSELVRQITLVPQRLEYVPAFPVRAFLRLSGPLTPEVISFAGIEEFLDRPISGLSGGELQKVLLAGAVAQRAGVMLLDEPTASLDPRGRRLVADALSELTSTTHTTRLMVTHDVQLALQWAERLVVMKGGTVVWQGRSSDERLGEVLSEAYECQFMRIPRPDGSGYLLVPT